MPDSREVLERISKALKSVGSPNMFDISIALASMNSRREDRYTSPTDSANCPIQSIGSKNPRLKLDSIQPKQTVQTRDTKRDCTSVFRSLKFL